jgi:nitroreductase/NAD-dependent dihydropyrimidine dehydrogenase PreA subunit
VAEIVNTINHETCIRCARCVNICPMDHLELVADRIRPSADPLRWCILCAHCMSVCPTKSVVTKSFDYHEFDDLPDKLPGLEDFLPLLKARRSMRHYQPQPVPREMLERILDAASTAPMAFPPSGVEIVVLDEREKIEEIIPAMLGEFRRWVYAFTSPLLKPLMRLMMPAYAIPSMQNEIIPFARGILIAAEKGRDLLTYEAPAMFLFHSSKFVESFVENCTLAKTYAMIAAEGLGLGTCIVGMIPPAVDRNRELRGKLGIPKGNQVVGCLVLGFPRDTHNRSIPRRFKSVKWL